MLEVFQAEKIVKAQYYLNSDDPLDKLVVKEIWDENVYRFTPSPEMRILDIGGHKGIFSIWCAAFGANVWAYEPNPDSYAIFGKNLELNGPMISKHVSFKLAGVWSEAGTLKFFKHPGSGAACLVACIVDGYTPDPAKVIDVNVVAFNDIVTGSIWDVVKIDTEGAEYEMLTTASDEALQSIRYLTVEVHNWASQEKYDKMMDRLKDFFYIEGVKEASGRWNYLYLTSRMI
jgi:FkbM family methyltransferase